MQAEPEVDNLFAGHALFDDWTAQQLNAVRRFSELREFSPNQLLFRENDPCAHLHLLDAGLVKLSRKTDGDGERVCEFVKAPALLYAQSVFLMGRYPLSAEALAETRVIAIRLDELHDFLHRHPDLMCKFGAAVARKVDTLLMREQRQSALNAEQRAAALLLEIFDSRNRWRMSRRAVKQVDMANLLSISPETFCRLLAGFRRRGWIGADHGLITILDRRGLKGILPALPNLPG